MDESICAVRSLTFFGPCLIINCSKFQPYVSAETQRTEKKLILVNPWFLWKYSESYFEGKLDETRYGHKRVWSVAKMQLRLSAEGFQMNLTVVKVSEEFVGILSALVKATFWRLFSVVWVAMFYVLIVNINSVLYIYAQTWWGSDLNLKTKHRESLGSSSKPFICSMRGLTQTSLIVMTMKVDWLRPESV